MQKVEVGKPYIHKCGGEELAKVLTYYGYLPDTSLMEQKIVCPFHKDVNPSMIINLETGTFFCFGCGLTGDAYKFVNLCNPKLNDIESMQKYYRILKSKKVEKLDFSNRSKKIKKPSKELYDISWDYYYGLSKVNWLKDETQEVSEARSYMLKRGFNSFTLNKCGAKITYNNSYPIIFPMLDNGEFKGWVCRTTDKEIEKRRKYLYNTGFSRRTTLVGEYSNCEYVFVVEGYMDCLKFIQYGVTNVVAILGWKMAKEQENKLNRSGAKYIISALDNDDCGKKGTEYLKTIFGNKVVRFQYLKGIKDIGETNKEQFDKMYNKTLELLKEKKHGFIRQNQSRRTKSRKQ